MITMLGSGWRMPAAAPSNARITMSCGKETLSPPRMPAARLATTSPVATALRNQYSLAYASTNTKRDGKFRKIKVQVRADINGDGKPDDLKVQTRQGYQAPKK